MTGLRSTPSRTGVLAIASTAARDALGVCAASDRLAEQAVGSIGVDDNRLFALLDERERMLSGLARQVAVLAGVKEDAGPLVDDVLTAVSASQRTTSALAQAVADRVEVLRAELVAVQRAGSASVGYDALDTSPHVDRVR